jgi:6-phosphogluconate dehydrogenase
MLDNKSVSKRAQEAGEDIKTMHDNMYAEFCNYTHSTAQRAILHIPKTRALLAKKTVAASLKSYMSIVVCVTMIIDLEVPQALIDAAISYFDKYRDSVILATLPRG